MNINFVVGLIIFIIILLSSLDVEAFDSNIIKTSFGEVEYSIQGDGMPVLVVHGIFGGFDQALQTGINLIGEEGKIIGVSRFGYLQSSLPDKSTPTNQARAYKELLDNLKLKEVVILAASAGGAPAIKFALEYPERTRVLILVGSDSPSRGEIKGPTGPPNFILNDFVFKIILSRPFRGIMRSSLFGIDKKVYNTASSKEKQQLDKIFNLLLPVKPRRPGIINDKEITNVVMNKDYDEYILENIKVSTLIIHAKDDPMASFERAKIMAERIPQSKFILYENGGHLIFGHQEEIHNVIKEFIGH